MLNFNSIDEWIFFTQPSSSHSKGLGSGWSLSKSSRSFYSEDVPLLTWIWALGLYHAGDIFIYLFFASLAVRRRPAVFVSKWICSWYLELSRFPSILTRASVWAEEKKPHKHDAVITMHRSGYGVLWVISCFGFMPDIFFRIMHKKCYFGLIRPWHILPHAFGLGSDETTSI